MGTGLNNRTGAGLPRRIQKDNLNAFEALGRQNPRLGFRKLANRFGNQRGMKVCPETIRISLKRQSYTSRRPKKIPAMTFLQKQRRMDFC